MDILVVHPDIMAKGGGESVCMHVLEALQDDHELTLLSKDPPDFEELNEFFSTSVTDVSWLRTDSATSIGFRFLHKRFGTLKFALLNRHIRKSKLAEEYDLLFSTFNDLWLDSPSIQYIHHPNFSKTAFPDIGSTHPLLKPLYGVYSPLCRWLGGGATDTSVETLYLSNSDWTADHIQAELGTRPRTVYPPVHVSDFPQSEWGEREAGFVTIGRISEDKKILRNIQIIAALRDRGHDVHYHVVGRMADESISVVGDSYASKVERAAREHDFVNIEGELSRDAMVELVSTHKYGLHGKEYEHFGIAVAELVAGGTIPFVHRSGGQQEVVGECEDIMYSSVMEATQKMSRTIQSSDRQTEIRASLPDVSETFSPERFKRQIRDVVQKFENRM
jgi:glycosyltransferase involved in cell wall biosynthesis